MIPTQIIEEITERASIVDVLSGYMTLTKKGVNFTACCPFHAENTPSFLVSPAKRIYKCFGCGASGNVITFLQNYESISFPEAVKILARKFDVALPEVKISAEDKKRYEHRDSLKILMQEAAGVYKSLITDKAAVDYLQPRGISEQVYTRFGVGFAPDAWHPVESALVKKGFKKDLILSSSLIKQGERGTYDYFRGRVMFPFTDISGNVLGFTGRTVIGDSTKYLNSPDTELFIKGRVLFGLHQAKLAISKTKHAYLVEGNFDVLSFFEKGIDNTVCGSGTAFTKEQALLLKRFTDLVTVVYDGDAAGVKATFKSIDVLIENGLDVRAVMLPEGEDPDSFARKCTSEELKAYLEKNSKDFISLKHSVLMSLAKADAIDEKDALHQVVNTIALIPDKILQKTYVKNAVKLFDTDLDTIKTELATKQKPTRIIPDNIIGWIGLDYATDAIRKDDLCYITYQPGELLAFNSQYGDNIISFAGELSLSYLQELRQLTSNVVIVDEVDELYTSTFKEHEVVKLGELLLSANFNVKCVDSKRTTDCDLISFLDFYRISINKFLDDRQYEDNWRRHITERAAEILSKAAPTVITIYSPDFAKAIKVKEADFKKILKPFLDRKKGLTSQLSENIVIDGERYVFEADELPEYVDQKFFYKYGFFPAQDKNGRKIFYVFRSENGALTNVGNFYMEPLFQVYDSDPNRNKRVVRLNHAELNTSTYVEAPSAQMIEFSTFKKFLWNEGGYFFTKGKQIHHEQIMASIATQFPKAYELNVFGQQHEGFYAFSNAILAKNEIIYVDNLGLVTYEDKTYYSPAFSEIHKYRRKDNDTYANDRFFVYRENSNVTFTEWCDLMCKVYKFNNNGHWAVVFTLMSAFRSVIYPIDRLFTALFFIGPTDSGKTQIAISIRSMFMHPDAPLLNLNSATDAAFFTSMERYRDVANVYEEYNDYQISDNKFQGLKAAVYDGEGKQKRKDASSKELDVSVINTAMVLLGQEGPERDDGALGNRCVIRPVQKNNNWTDEERLRFEQLKQIEKTGLSCVLVEILKHREEVKKHFQQIQRKVSKELKTDIVRGGNQLETRILNTISLFLAMVKLWETYVPTLKLTFTYNEFYEIAKQQIVDQSETISSSNRLSVFFDTLTLLLNREHGGIKENKEFKIELIDEVTVMKDRANNEVKTFDKPTKVLFLRINLILPLYRDLLRTESLKQNALMMYLKDSPAYIGHVKSTRFTWKEVQEFPSPSGFVEKKIVYPSTNTSALALNYEMLDIDLEKYSEMDQVQDDNKKSNSRDPILQESQNELPF